jgi:hypothetical protein
MFQKALSIAYEFTRPVVISRKTVSGQCESMIGTFIIINSDGWIVTAAHILRLWKKLSDGVAQTKATLDFQSSVNADSSLSKKEKAQKLAAGPKVTADSNDKCSAWWAIDKTLLKDFRYIDVQDKVFGDVADIGVGRLDPFDPTTVKSYPVFKNPSVNFEPGKSLCRLGFPFHQIIPTWDATGQRFVLPVGALPMPRFPNEGMFTRINEIQFAAGDKPPIPYRYVETSTPGVPGQSGGPIFDSDGLIWAIQSKTSSYDLGFRPLKTPQFMNVGLGVHAETVIGFLKDQKIKHEVSTV